MSRITCRDVADRLHRRAEGHLSLAEVQGLDEHVAACAGCRQAAERLLSIEGSLRRPAVPARGFSDRVLRRVRTVGASRAAAEPTPRLAAWRMLPLATAALLVAALAIRGLVVAPPVAGPVAQQPVEPPRIQVELELAKTGARTVAVAGDFNQWQAEGSRMTLGSDGVWRIRLELPPGRYQYAFVIDGEQWIADPQASTVVDSGFSGTNSVLDVSL